MKENRVFRTKTFSRWMSKSGLSDADLTQAAREMFVGLIDADLGGHLVKKRVALAGRGKRGGARTIVATKFSDRWFFLFGFGKNEKANISKDELKIFQEVAKDFLEFDEAKLQAAILAGELTEVCDDNEQA